MKNSHILCLFMLVFFGLSCQEPSVIGGSIINDDDLLISNEDDFLLKARSINSEVFPAYSVFVTNTNFQIGKYEDAQFGTTDVQLFSGILRNTFGDTTFFNGGVVDSAVMVLSYDSTYIYGPTDGSFDFSVTEVIEDMGVDTIWSDKSFETSPAVLGSKAVKFAPSSNVKIKNYISGVEEELGPQIRIPLSLNQSLFDDAIYESTASFKNIFKGVHIQASSTNNAVMSLLFGVTADGVNGQNGIHIHYRDVTGKKRIYRLLFSNRKVTYHKSQFAESINGATLNSYENGEDLVFVQGMSGPSVEVKFSDLISKMRGRAINSAHLEVTVADVDGEDYSIYPPNIQLTAKYRSGDGFKNIRDIVLANTSGLQIYDTFGGNSVTENGITSYKMNITNHIQDIVKEVKTNTLILSPYFRRSNPRRTILNGPNSNVNPMKLTITFTEDK